MKKTSIILLFILSLSLTLTTAQTIPSAAPTRDDAVAFLKTVYTIAEQDPYLSRNVATHDNINLELNGCILKLSYRSIANDRSWSFNIDYLIDLSKVKAYKFEESGSSTFLDLEQLSKNSITVERQDETTNTTRFLQDDEVGNLFFNINENVPIIKESHYVDRALKALNFLIKGCGGGVVPVDPNSKF